MSVLTQPTIDTASTPSSTPSTPATDPHHGDPHLAHHYETAAQQFNAAKLGMWLFLATEVLLFGGLFCLYAVFRANEPEVFEYGARSLDTRLGALNTGLLILSSMTMAFAVNAAQQSHRKRLCVLLALTIIGGAGFMVIKYFEYSHKIHERLVWGTNYYQAPHHLLASAGAGGDLEAASEFTADAAVGRELWMATCRACHGIAGEGIPGQGKDIRGSSFLEENTDEQLLAFVKVGRMPFDPLNTTGIQMPPKGGNPLLNDNDIRHIVAYIRTFEAPTGDEPVSAEETDAPIPELWIEKSSIPLAPQGPAGLELTRLTPVGDFETFEEPAPPAVHHVVDPEMPRNAHLFFNVYFLMTGLHGIHVLVGMACIGWLLVRAFRGHFNRRYFTPVDLVGLYWHVVDLIWIFLFPLLYLIG